MTLTVDHSAVPRADGEGGGSNTGQFLMEKSPPPGSLLRGNQQLKRAKARKAGPDGTKAKVEIAIPMFGYKNHVGIDAAHRLIRAFTGT